MSTTAPVASVQCPFCQGTGVPISGEDLRSLRKSLKLSQQKAASVLGISQPALSRAEKLPRLSVKWYKRFIALNEKGRQSEHNEQQNEKAE